MSKGHCPPCPCFLERLLLKCCQATRSSKPWRSNRPSCGLWSWCQQPHTHGNWPPMDGYRWRRRSSELVSGNLSGCIQASCQSLDCAFTPRWHRTTDGTTDAPPTGAVDEEWDRGGRLPCALSSGQPRHQLSHPSARPSEMEGCGWRRKARLVQVILMTYMGLPLSRILWTRGKHSFLQVARLGPYWSGPVVRWFTNNPSSG